MFISESVDDAESELDRELLPNHLEWQGTKVEQKRVEERAGSRELSSQTWQATCSLILEYTTCLRP